MGPFQWSEQGFLTIFCSQVFMASITLSHFLRSVTLKVHLRNSQSFPTLAIRPVVGQVTTHHLVSSNFVYKFHNSFSERISWTPRAHLYILSMFGKKSYTSKCRDIFQRTEIDITKYRSHYTFIHFGTHSFILNKNVKNQNIQSWLL